MNGFMGSRAAIFWLQVLYLLILAFPAAVFVTRPALVPPMLGPIPTGVPWFGALGAVMISLWGVTEHRNDWDARWKYWHWSRAFVGASLAVITVLILKAGILAVGSTATEPQGTARNLLYYVIAFVVGYREETFRELVKKVADVILGPGSAPAMPTIVALDPAKGPAAGGTRVMISGSGFAGVTAVRFGATKADYSIKSEASIEATSPQAAAPGAVPVVVEAPGGRAAVGEFTYS
jgi:hypothetical protein